MSSTNIKWLIMSTFVDDINVMDIKKSEIINRVKQKLVTAFKIIDIRSISFYLDLDKIENI